MFLISMWMIYIFPYIARFTTDLKSVLKNSLVMAEGNIPTTVTLGLILLLVFFLIGKAPILILILPSLYVLLCDVFLEIIFRRYLTDEARDREDLLNGGPDKLTANLEIAGKVKAEKREAKRAAKKELKHTGENNKKEAL